MYVNFNTYAIHTCYNTVHSSDPVTNIDIILKIASCLAASVPLVRGVGAGGPAPLHIHTFCYYCEVHKIFDDSMYRYSCGNRICMFCCCSIFGITIIYIAIKKTDSQISGWMKECLQIACFVT